VPGKPYFIHARIDAVDEVAKRTYTSNIGSQPIILNSEQPENNDDLKEETVVMTDEVSKIFVLKSSGTVDYKP